MLDADGTQLSFTKMFHRIQRIQWQKIFMITEKQLEPATYYGRDQNATDMCETEDLEIEPNSRFSDLTYSLNTSVQFSL